MWPVSVATILGLGILAAAAHADAADAAQGFARLGMADGNRLSPCTMNSDSFEQNVTHLWSSSSSDSEISVTHVGIPLSESGWRLSIRRESGGSTMILTRFEKPSLGEASYADATSPDSVTYRRPIGDRLAARMSETWAIALDQIGPMTFGFDGTTYEFSESEGACGIAWSPKTDTMPGKLVGLVTEFRGLPMIKDDALAAERESALLAAVEDFIEEYK